MAAITDTGRKYWAHCSGLALETVNKHSSEEDLTFFAAGFCPFVQRVWVALEFLEVPYKYYEVDPYKKPKDLVEVSPRGLVPALKIWKQGSLVFDLPRALNESTVIMEYVQGLAQNSSSTARSLFPDPRDPYACALVRLQADHINRHLVPAFYRYLQAQDPAAQIAGGREFHAALEGLVTLLENAEKVCAGDGGDGDLKSVGLWYECGEMGWTDVMAGPWLFRATNVLKHYRGFELPSGVKFNAWLKRLLGHPAFKRTCSDEELYLDSYERYAFNRPNTSQVADAINSGRGLP